MQVNAVPLKSALNKHVCACVFTLCVVVNVLWRAVVVSVISTKVYQGSLSCSGAESEWFCSLHVIIPGL